MESRKWTSSTLTPLGQFGWRGVKAQPSLTRLPFQSARPWAKFSSPAAPWVCAILIGSDTDELSSGFRHALSGRDGWSRTNRFGDDLFKVMRLIDKPSEGLDLPLDMRHGTPFERRGVGRSSCDPCGADVTLALAHHRHAERGRAVASACAAPTRSLGHPLPPGGPERRLLWRAIAGAWSASER